MYEDSYEACKRKPTLPGFEVKSAILLAKLMELKKVTMYRWSSLMVFLDCLKKGTTMLESDVSEHVAQLEMFDIPVLGATVKSSEFIVY